MEVVAWVVVVPLVVSALAVVVLICFVEAVLVVVGTVVVVDIVVFKVDDVGRGGVVLGRQYSGCMGLHL